MKTRILKIAYILGVLLITQHSIAQKYLIDNPEVVLDEELNRFLQPIEGSFRVLSCSYDNEKLYTKQSFTSDQLRDGDNQWDCKLTVDAISKEAVDVKINCILREGVVESGGIAFAIDFWKWSEENYVMIPASVYNGNRNRMVDRSYGIGLDRSDLYRKDLPLTTALIPHLSIEENKSSLIEVNSSYCTTPSICILDRTKKQGMIVLTEQGLKTKHGLIKDYGLIVEESADKKRATILISAPGVLEKKPEFTGFSKSPYRGVKLVAGDSIQLNIRIYRFKAKEVTTLLDKFMTVRQTVITDHAPRNLIPASETLKLMTKNIDNRYYKGDAGAFYCPENANWISFGWIGGLMNTFPMLALGDAEHRQKVFNTFDFAIPAAQGKAGYFYGAQDHNGKVFGREGYDEAPEIVLTRKNADVLFWMIKQFKLLQSQGYEREIKPIWNQSIKRLADAFVTTWKKDKQWGNFLNTETGDIAVYNTSSGVMAIAGLALASEYYNQPEYLKIACDAANHYYKNHFIKLGMTTGGCADILQNADSETAVAFMTSLMALYEVTEEEKWLKKSQHLANLSASWVVSYNYELPKEMDLAKLNASLVGAVWASTQNKHGAPGFCTSSGDPLFKLYRTGGDERYATLMRDIIHAHAEGIQPNGQITERLTYCDADSRGSRGEGGKTGWNELNGALMAMEIPGIYLRTDIDQLFVFDHIEVQSIRRESKRIVLKINNPTLYDAEVTYLAENAKQVKKPLGYVAFMQWPKIKIKAGETVELSIPIQ